MLRTAIANTRTLPKTVLTAHRAASNMVAASQSATAPVKTLPLGNREVPALCIGTWAWGDSTWKYDEARDFPPIQEAWRAALESGETFFDTAEIYGYGESEKIIGRLLAETSEEDKRKVVLATKYFPLPTPTNLSFIFRPGCVQALRNSLKRMGVEQVELYQIHGVIGPHSWAAQGRALAECQKLGLCKQVGVSNFNKDQLIKMHDILASHGVKLASNQIEYSLLRTLPEQTGLLAAMRERGIACLAYSPLGQGRLTGKYSAANPPPSGRKFSNYPMEELEPLLEVMRGLSKKHDVPISAIALNWVIGKGAIPLGGARNRKQAEENAKALTFTLSHEDMAALDEKTIVGKTSFWQNG